MTHNAGWADDVALSAQDVSDIGDYAARSWAALDSDEEELAHCIGMILYRLQLEPFAPDSAVEPEERAA